MVSPSRRTVAVSLTLLVVLAGCFGPPASNQQSTVQTSQTVEPPEETVANFSYSSGWSQEGITDLDVAVRAHHHAVAGISQRTRFVRTHDDSNRTVYRAFDAEAGVGVSRLISTGLDADIHRYYSGDGMYKYNHTSGELTRSPDEDGNGEGLTVVNGLDSGLMALELNATETVTAAGETAVTYEVTGIEDPDEVPADDATGHVTVTEDGVITSFTVTRSADGSTWTRTFELSEFGTATVTPSEWVPDE